VLVAILAVAVDQAVEEISYLTSVSDSDTVSDAAPWFRCQAGDSGVLIAATGI
jgi:hypothetical protein